MFALVVVVAAWRGAARCRRRERRLCGWLMFVFGFLGLYVWAPTVTYFFRPEADDWWFALNFAGIGLGVVGGYLLARMIAVVVVGDDEPDEVSDADAD